MKWGVGIIAAVCFLVCGLGVSLAHAHRVGVFCWVEGDKLHTQSKFQPGGPVKGGTLQILLPSTGEVLATGITDTKGEYIFEIPARVRKERLGFRVSLLAGSGHKGHWDVPAAEFADGLDDSLNSSGALVKKVSPALSREPVSRPDDAKNVISPEGLQKLLDRELERKLAPIKRTLAQMQEDRPSVSEILGGIGYIFGIMGVVLYFRSKKSA